MHLGLVSEILFQLPLLTNYTFLVVNSFHLQQNSVREITVARRRVASLPTPGRTDTRIVVKYARRIHPFSGAHMRQSWRHWVVVEAPVRHTQTRSLLLQLIKIVDKKSKTQCALVHEIPLTTLNGVVASCADS